MNFSADQLAPLTLFFALAISAWNIVLAGWMGRPT